MNEHQFRELSAARALHALSPEEEQQFSRALSAHPEWRVIADEDSETAAALGDATAQVAPPAAARASILDLIAATPQFEAPEASHEPDSLTIAGAGLAPAYSDAFESVDENAAGTAGTAGTAVPAGTSLGQSRARKRAGWFALAASVAVLLAAALVFPWGGVNAPKDPVTAALQQVEAAPDAATVTAALADGGTATLHWSKTTEQAVFVTDGMRATPTDQDYELWIVRGEQPISLGVMSVGSDGNAAVLATGFTPGDALAITVEEAGGSPSGAPTTDPIVVLATA